MASLSITGLGEKSCGVYLPIYLTRGGDVKHVHVTKPDEEQDIKSTFQLE